MFKPEYNLVSYRYQSEVSKLSMSLPLGAISFAMSTRQWQSINQDTIYTATIPWTFNATNTGGDLGSYVKRIIAIYRSMSQTGQDLQLVCFNENQIALHCNHSGVSISTHVFEVYMLQFKVNRLNYVYITWLLQSCYLLQHSWNMHN